MSTETYVDTFDYGGLRGRFASIDSASSGGGYDWDEFHLLRGVDGLLYVGYASGCSCNSFCDEDPSTFTRVETWQDAAAEAQAWADSDEWSREDRKGAAMDLIERLNRHRPASSISVDARDPWGAKR